MNNVSNLITGWICEKCRSWTGDCDDSTCSIKIARDNRWRWFQQLEEDLIAQIKTRKPERLGYGIDSELQRGNKDTKRI